ncbi:MAG: DUF2284 domain-containing protein [Eisenbergiella sp.]
MAADKLPETIGNTEPAPEHFKEKIVALGAKAAALIAVEDISFDTSFRSMCASNACGNYGRSYMCPPDIGEIETLIREAKSYSYALVYQTVGLLEDSYDFEGMMEAGQRHNDLAQNVRNLFEQECGKKALHLGAGGCHLCPVCGKKTGEPCRFPDRAMSSLEAYGVNVSELAVQCGMRYINGENTVTYFGAVFF